jgi:hypothetical protein
VATILQLTLPSYRSCTPRRYFFQR